ncbi:MAG: inovirus Gp2 family protein [Proteobacteria bacterium]|nr:inovirus Gp2 family protein [Pseudomonadota bacterium]MBU1542378.1 inovirus Gp2 family protein [Pseudomonadota bacterium]
MKTVILTKTYNHFPLSYSNKNNNGFYINILDSLQRLFNTMFYRHSQVFVIRLDLTYPTGIQYPHDNVLFSRFIEALTLYCKRIRKSKRTGNLVGDYDPMYLWTREDSGTGQHHFHILLLLNGNKIQNGRGISEKAKELWNGCLGVHAEGLVHLCMPGGAYDQYGGVKLVRGSIDFPELFENVFKWTSYLAKVYSKGNGPKHVKEYGMSRL